MKVGCFGLHLEGQILGIAVLIHRLAIAPPSKLRPMEGRIHI